MPCPFTRVLTVQNPLLNGIFSIIFLSYSHPSIGSDVYMLQNILQRAVETTPITSYYDAKTEYAVQQFQKQNSVYVPPSFPLLNLNPYNGNYTEQQQGYLMPSLQIYCWNSIWTMTDTLTMVKYQLV